MVYEGNGDLLGEGCAEVIVVELAGPAGVLAVLRAQGLDERWGQYALLARSARTRVLSTATGSRLARLAA